MAVVRIQDRRRNAAKSEFYNHHLELVRVSLKPENSDAVDHDFSASPSLVPADLWAIPHLVWSVVGPPAIVGSFLVIPYFAPSLHHSKIYNQLGAGVIYFSLLVGYLPLCIATGRRKLENFVALMFLSPVYCWAGWWLLFFESLFLAGRLYGTYL